MKFSKLLALSSATALALAAGAASAFTVNWNVDKDNANGTDTGTVTIWHGGASASTSSMQTAVIGAFCDIAQPIDVLEDARVLGKPEFWAVACMGKGTLSASLAGKKILWNKRDEGGSGVGVGPLATNPPTAVGFMKPSTGVGNNCPTGAAAVRGGVAVTLWNCTNFAVPVDAYNEADASTDGVLRVPEIGTSDIEPDKFASIFPQNVPVADLNLDGNQNNDPLPAYKTAGVLSDVGLAQLIFGVPVNVVMYQDLQRAQFPAGHPLNADCHPAGANYGSIANSANNANSEKCMPSLTGQEIRSIQMAGGAIRSTLDFQAENPFGSAAFSQLTGTGTTDNTIQICRRVNGSGTQAQFNAIMLGYPCDPTGDGTIDTLVPETEGAFTTFVVNNSGSGDVEKCLNDYNNATNVTGKNAALRKRWAIGVQSLEKNAPSGGAYSNAYRFIKVDGFAPTLANAHAGDYYDVARQSIQTRIGTATVNVDARDALVPFVDNKVNLDALNKTHAFGRSGWLGSPRSTQVPDSALNVSQPVAWFQRVSGAKSNTCALPSAFKKTGGTGVDITVGPQNCSNNGDADNNCYTP